MELAELARGTVALAFGLVAQRGRATRVELVPARTIEPTGLDDVAVALDRSGLAGLVRADPTLGAAEAGRGAGIEPTPAVARCLAELKLRLLTVPFVGRARGRQAHALRFVAQRVGRAHGGVVPAGAPAVARLEDVAHAARRAQGTPVTALDQ